MKKLIAFILLAAMMTAVLTGCGAKELPAAQNEPTETAVIAEPLPEETEETEAVEVPAPAEPGLDTVVLREEGTVPGVVAAEYRLPKLDVDYPVAKEFEEWVDGVFDTWLESLEWYAEDGRCLLDYETAVYHDVLAVEFLVNGEETFFNSYSNKFSIDLRTNEELTVEGILDRAGATREQLEDFIRIDQKEYFDFEDRECGYIQNAAVFREKMMSSENLKDITIQVSVQLKGTLQIGVPSTYYVDTTVSPAAAKADPCRTSCYSYLDDPRDLLGESEVRNAGEWIADGEKGTVETAFYAAYSLPSLISDKIDRNAFDTWVQNGLAEWTESAKHRLPESFDVVENNGMHLSYRAYVIGDVLSVMFTDDYGMCMDIRDNAPAISFDLTTGKPLQLQEVLQKAGFSAEQLYASAAGEMQRYWNWETENYGAAEGIEEAHAATVAKENLDQARFVIWPGDVDAYKSGQVTLMVRDAYRLRVINGIPNVKMEAGGWSGNLFIAGLRIR